VDRHLIETGKKSEINKRGISVCPLIVPRKVLKNYEPDQTTNI